MNEKRLRKNLNYRTPADMCGTCSHCREDELYYKCYVSKLTLIVSINGVCRKWTARD
ncbi:MAG: hypothetical protein GY853_06655 [PVC group bacterium]|nr:hypothetical protein [PVC group bacterium]